MSQHFVQKTATLLIIAGLMTSSFVPLSARAGIADSLQSDYSGDVQDNFEDGVVACAATGAIAWAIGAILSYFNVPTNDTSVNLKEYIFDCVFWAFKNALIQELTGETVQWIQNGMQGNPAFVQNLQQHLRSTADKAAAEAIGQSVPFISSVYRDEIHRQLIDLYKSERGDDYMQRITPTFTQSEEQLERFFAGDFSSGGWSMWFEAFSKPANNPYGTYLELSSELANRVATAEDDARTKLDWGQGFFPKEVQNCYERIVAAANGEQVTLTECDPSLVLTPGAQIKSSLEQVIGVNLDQIAAADEWDEIVVLWATYLVLDLLKGDDGLAGYDPDDFEHELPDVTLPGGDDTTPGDSEPPGPPGPSVCFESNGVFLRPEQGGTLTKGYEFPLPQNVSYDRIELELDVRSDGWDEEGLAGMIFWLVRNGNKNMYGYSKMNGPNKNDVMLRWGVGQNHGSKPKVVKNLQFPEDATYRFTYVYDAASDSLQLKVINAGSGAVLQTISGVPDIPGINVGNEKFRIGFGYHDQEANAGVEVPMYGWEYSDFKISFISGTDVPTNCTAPNSWNGGTDRPSDDPPPIGDDDGPDPNDRSGGGDDNEELSLVEALQQYVSIGEKATDPTVLKYLRTARTDGWNSFGGSQNLSPIAFASVGDYKFFHELANVENSEGIGSREVGSPGFYFSMPIAAKIVALRDARAAGDAAAADAIAKNLLQTWTFWSLVAIEGTRTSVAANSAGQVTTAGGDDSFRGLAVATAGDRYHGGSDANAMRGNDQSKILAWALDVPRSMGGGSRNLRSASGFWWDTIIAHAIGTDRYADPTPAEKWGMTEEDRAKLRKLVRGDASVLPWALGVVSPGLYQGYHARMRRTTEGVETVFVSITNGNKPAQTVTAITNGGAVTTMRPCDGNADGANQGYSVTIEGGTITATGDPPRCSTQRQEELGGALVYEVTFANGRVN